MVFDPTRAEGLTDGSCSVTRRFSFHFGLLTIMLTGVLFRLIPRLQVFTPFGNDAQSTDRNQ